MEVTDLIDKLTAMRDRLDVLMGEENVRAGKLDAELADLELRIILANALAALERATPYVRHNGPRQQITGARDQIRKVLVA